jgi:hypothetical protein
VAIVSLILGAIGAVAGMGALAWNVVAWRRSGPVVTVVGDWDSSGPGVTVRNSGRAPATISEWGFHRGPLKLRAPDGLATSSPQLPYRLEQGERVSWRIKHEALKAYCRARGLDEAELVPYVILATGASVRAKYAGFWP